MSEYAFPYRMLISDMDGCLTDGSIYIGNNGTEMRRFSIYDGMAFTILHKHSIITGILSNGHEPAYAEKRAEQLNIRYCYTGLANKEEVLRQWSLDSGVALDEIAYIGDDINDIPVLKLVGYAACPSNAVDEVKAVAQYHLTKAGGYGCLREFIHLNMK